MNQISTRLSLNVSGERKTVTKYLALFMVYLFWGGTYLGMRLAIQTIPPFIMAGIRFLTAGSILYLWATLSGAAQPRLEHWKNGAIVGILLLLTGNGLVVWAEQTVSSGIASLLVATVPLWIILIEWFWNKQRGINLGIILGIALGFTGIIILVYHSFTAMDHRDMNPVGMIALLLASLSWAAGSMYSRQARLPDSPLMSTAIQMLVGGALLLIFGTFLGEWSQFTITQISTRSWVALGYLIFFGSILGYNAYIWLLKNAEPVLVSTYAFVNPIVAVLLGWVLAGERLTANSLVAAVVIISAVVIITVNHKN